MGDLIIGRRNDSTMRISQAEHDVPAADPVRNGNCWRVAAVDADRNRIATRRLSDGPAIFGGDNMREHITDGNAVTVHAAQGVTADTSHAVLGENASRAALYMAMTRVRESNNAYRYQHEAEASEYGDARPDKLHVPSSSGKSSPPMRAHITHGYAVTLHAAQAVTADTSHAVLGENTSRASLYVAMTPESNSAYLYERGAEASDYSDARPDALHVPPSSSGKSSPPMRAHRPHTNSPPKPVETVCQHACQPCLSTAAPTVGRRGERPTASGAQRPSSGRPVTKRAPTNTYTNA